MKKTFTLISLSALLAFAPTAQAQDKLYNDEFPLGDVTLLDGPLKKARDLNIKTLLQYDCDRLLAPYRKEAGLEPKAKAYPNWDGLDGHVGGHYLTAMALNAATGDEECRRRMEYMIGELQLCADANAKNHPEWGRGYVGGMPNSERIWSNFKRGDFGTYFGSWAPFYNLHKMYAGLRDAWLYCGNEQAKRLFLGFCDWAIDLTASLSDDQMERMLGNEHGGMNEVLADAYAITGDAKYLNVARRFSHRRLLTPMSQRQDCLDNMHANTQVPKVVGFERIAELAGDEVYHDAADFFWDIVTGERSLAFGGNSRREHFPSKDACMDFINDIDGPETCNTNNMLKLTEDLHRRNPEARYADYYELATFNHILSSQHPEHGGYVYFTPARPRHYRNYSAPNEAMWCCVGTGMENHGKYGQFVYTHRGNALYVNLFVSSQLNWRDRGLLLRQETQFPYAETSRITIVKAPSQRGRAGGESFPLLVRYPGWRADIDRTMDEGRYTFVVVLPVNFEKDVMANNTPLVQVNVDATRMSQAFTGAGYIQQILSDAVSDFVRNSSGEDSSSAANLVVRKRYNANLNSSWFNALMQLANNVAMLAIILTGSALITERESGTLEHLLVMPVTPFQIMLSKIWSMMAVVMAAALAGLFLIVRFYLQVPLAGSYFLYAFGLALYLFALTSLGIFLACMSSNMPQLGMLIILVLMPLEMLSGSSTPQESMPVWVQRVMQFAPTTHFVSITQGILFRGAGLRAMWPPFLKLFLIGAVLFVISMRRFRKSVA